MNDSFKNDYYWLSKDKLTLCVANHLKLLYERIRD